MTRSHLEVFITHNASASHWMIITVYGADEEPLHRQVMWTLSGLQITTSLGQGEHQIALMNNARAERFPNEAWEVSAMPSVEFDRMANDELRLSILLTDVTANGSIGSGSNVGMQFVSQGPLTLFTGRAYNVNFNVFNALHDVITPQYHNSWLSEYTVQRSAGTLDTYIGFAPYERASGADGFSVSAQSLPLYFEVDIQRGGESVNGCMRGVDEAVSAAVATVLLFGGVLSIIGLMMVFMMPVIEEMEGSVERHDMSSQMTLLAHETSALSERGMPGDSAQATLIPVDGELVWDSLRGGCGIQATWVEDMSLRARGRWILTTRWRFDTLRVSLKPFASPTFAWDRTDRTTTPWRRFSMRRW